MTWLRDTNSPTYIPRMSELVLLQDLDMHHHLRLILDWNISMLQGQDWQESRTYQRADPFSMIWYLGSITFWNGRTFYHNVDDFIYRIKRCYFLRHIIYSLELYVYCPNGCLYHDLCIPLSVQHYKPDSLEASPGFDFGKPDPGSSHNSSINGIWEKEMILSRARGAGSPVNRLSSKPRQDTVH